MRSPREATMSMPCCTCKHTSWIDCNFSLKLFFSSCRHNQCFSYSQPFGGCSTYWCILICPCPVCSSNMLCTLWTESKMLCTWHAPITCELALDIILNIQTYEQALSKHPKTSSIPFIQAPIQLKKNIPAQCCWKTV